MVSEAPPEDWGTPHYVPQQNALPCAPSASASSGAQPGASTPPDAQASTSADGQPAPEADTGLQAESDLKGSPRICNHPCLQLICQSTRLYAKLLCHRYVAGVAGVSRCQVLHVLKEI